MTPQGGGGDSPPTPPPERGPKRLNQKKTLSQSTKERVSYDKYPAKREEGEGKCANQLSALEASVSSYHWWADIRGGRE